MMSDEVEKNGELKTILTRKTPAFSLALDLSKDRVKLFISITPIPDESGAFEKIVSDEIYEQIKEIVPLERVNDDVIEDICQRVGKGDTIKQRRIARGQEALPGKDGKLLLLVKPMNKDSHTNEQVGLRLIKHFDNVESEQPIGRIYHPIPGTEGIDALGQKLQPPESKPFSIELDGSVERIVRKDDECPFDVLVAKRAGYVTQSGNKISVITELVIDDDLDLKVGDIDFVGQLVVKGSVMKGFRVVSRGNIAVSGNVLASSVASHTGDIRIAGQVFGDSTPSVTTSDSTAQINHVDRSRLPSQILAHGTFSAMSLENVTAEVFGDIEIAQEIRNSVLRTRSLLKIPKGVVIGGEVHCVCGLEANEIGRSSGATTLIFLESDVESSAEYAAIMTQIRRIDDAEKLTRGYLGKYADEPAEIEKLSGHYKTKTIQLVKQLEALLKSKALMLAERDKLMRHAHESTTHRVNVLGTLYPGVKITAGDLVFTTEKPLVGPKTIEFLRSENKFVVSDLQPLICEFNDDKEKEG